MELITIAIIIALILSIVIHEVAHGYAAHLLGDPTARLAGRLSGNPLVHIDPVGSVLIPGLLFLSNAGILFGWAKPVPYNPYNLRFPKWGEALVAAAGPAVNLFLALLFGLLIRFADLLSLSAAFIELAAYIVFINILLALFNLIPFPPLDGSKILPPLLPAGAAQAYGRLVSLAERYNIFVFFGFIAVVLLFLWPYLFSGVVWLAALFSGVAPVEFVGFIR